MDKNVEREQKIQKQYDEWFEREKAKGEAAKRRGDHEAEHRHFHNAQRYAKMGDESLERMKAAKAEAKGGGCLLSLMLIPLHLFTRFVLGRPYGR